MCSVILRTVEKYLDQAGHGRDSYILCVRRLRAVWRVATRVLAGSGQAGRVRVRSALFSSHGET